MVLDISGFTQEMLQATSIAQLFPSTVTAFLANPLLGLVNVAKQVGDALVGLFNESASHADNLGEMATNAGVAVETLSGLGLIAEQSGASLAAVADGFKFLGKNAAEAALGNKQAMAEFTRLGVAATDADGKVRPLEDLMFDVADALKNLTPGAEQTNAAMGLLGRSGTALIGTLGQGSEALRDQMRTLDQYHATVNSRAAQSGGAWKDAMDEMRFAWVGFKNQIAEPLRDTLLPYLNGLLGWARTHPAEITAAAQGVAKAAAEAVTWIIGAGAALKPILEFGSEHLGAIGLGAAAVLIGV